MQENMIEYPVRPALPPVGLVLLVLFLAFLLGMLSSGLLSQVAARLGWADVQAIAGQIDANSPDAHIWQARWAAMAGHILSFLAPAAFTLWYFRQSDRPMLEAASLRRFPSASAIGLGVLMMIVAMPLVLYSYQINRELPMPEWMTASSKQLEETIKALMRMDSFGAFLVNFLLIAILPAVGEELMFRGVIQTQLMRRMPAWGAIIVTAAVFSFIHFQFDGFVPRMLMGVLLGWLYWRTGNLWVSVFAHLFNNGIQIVAQYLYRSEISTLDLEQDITLPWYIALFSMVTALWVSEQFRRLETDKKT